MSRSYSPTGRVVQEYNDPTILAMWRNEDAKNGKLGQATRRASSRVISTTVR